MMFFFQGPGRYCLKYGEVYADSEKLEGVMAFVPGKYQDMTIHRAIRAGSVSMILKGGFELIKLMGKLNKIFKPLEEARRKTMDNRDFIYLIIIGVSPDRQG